MQHAEQANVANSFRPNHIPPQLPISRDPMSNHLNPPYGGTLQNLVMPPEEAEALKAGLTKVPALGLNERQLCDLELLLNGGFSPLRGFMGRADYEGVLKDMRLTDGTLWPLPIMLSVSQELAEQARENGRLALTDPEGLNLAVLEVGECWEYDREAEAQAVYGTTSMEHPGVRYLMEEEGPVYITGTLKGLQRPLRYDHRALRLNPAELRSEFSRMGWRRIAGFHTRNPIHRNLREMTMAAATRVGANLLVHPVVSAPGQGEFDHHTRVRCYQAVQRHYPPNLMRLSLLSLSMRRAGPRETLLHAIIRKNHGCSHFIVGRNHAGPSEERQDNQFYGPYEAQELMAKHQEELGIEMIPFQEMVYVPGRAQFLPVDEVPEQEPTLAITNAELHRRLNLGLDFPPWYSYPEVLAELRQAYPARDKQGFTLFFTGLSGAGKSTVANVLLARFLELGGRPVTLLDGDIVRRNLSSELGFTKEHRDLNILRIGFVANEITKNRGIAICAPIAPYRDIRRQVREMISPSGGFIEIFVGTPLEVCEGRDRKGLYAKARAGIIANFTGISDPYEEPEHPEIVLDTSNHSPDECAQQVLIHLEREGYLA